MDLTVKLKERRSKHTPDKKMIAMVKAMLSSERRREKLAHVT
jgi:hypothetical protein